MKKLVLSFLAFTLTFMVYAQPVSDQATIPISVTISSILRLHVTTGGNIEFVFNTLADMDAGINATEGTTTRFTVASSQDFDVKVWAESQFMTGTDSTTYTAGTAPAVADLIAYTVSEDAGSATTVAAGTTSLTHLPVTVVTEGAPGDVSDNMYSIAWECATGNGSTNSGVAGLAPDRYSNNVFLVLERN